MRGGVVAGGVALLVIGLFFTSIFGGTWGIYGGYEGGGEQAQEIP